jgi:hypothetical protein
MLDEDLVFQKSEAGAREMAAPAHGLSPKLRRALILVDGTKSVAQLAHLFRAGEVDAILLELQAKGLVLLPGGAIASAAPEPSPGAAQSPAAAVTPEQFDEVRRRAMREVSDRLGPNGDTLALKIERCATPEQLRAALREAETIMASFLGAEYGRNFARKIGRDLL